MSEAGATLTICYGNAQPGDDNFADVVAVVSDIIAVLAERERRKHKKRERQCRSRGMGAAQLGLVRAASSKAPSLFNASELERRAAVAR